MLKRIYLEISDYCNLSCSFCTSSRKNKTMMSLDNFKLIVDKIKGYANELYLHVLGEPLIHPNIIEMIEYAKDSFNVQITTNGRLINKIEQDLVNSGFSRMNISLNSSLDLDESRLVDYLNQITSFIEKVHKLNPNVSFNLRLWAYDSNDFKVELVEEYLEKHYGIKLEKRNNTRLKERVILTYEKEFEWPSLNNPYYSDKGKCLGIKTHISILSNGDVGVCCLDTLCDSKLGNIYHDDLGDILNSPKALEIIKGFNDNKLVLDICKHCSYHD